MFRCAYSTVCRVGNFTWGEDTEWGQWMGSNGHLNSPHFTKLALEMDHILGVRNVISPPTQVLHGPPGVMPAEPLVDFIHSHHLHFTGGIFWINCRTPRLIEASLTHIKDVSLCNYLCIAYNTTEILYMHLWSVDLLCNYM